MTRTPRHWTARRGRRSANPCSPTRALPEDAEQLLAAHNQQLDETDQAVAERVDANTAVSIDTDGRVQVAAIKAIEEPESLIELRKRVTAMIPRGDVSEAILEVLGGARSSWTR